MFRASPDISTAQTAVADASPSESVYESDTPAGALAEVSAALGSDAEVLGIETVLRGGVGGFFAREVVQVRARRRSQVDLGAAEEHADRPSAGSEGEPAIARVLAQLTREVDGSERTFAAALRTELGRQDGASPVLVAPAGDPDQPAAPAPAPAAPAPVPGSPCWSAENLVRLGLPGAFARAVAAQDPGDDLGWVYALGRALATLCRPLPAGAHVVVGGSGWRELLFDEPLALSWSTPAHLPVAVGLCAELGLILGSGPGPSGQVQRANPVDLAMVVRGLLPRW